MAYIARRAGPATLTPVDPAQLIYTTLGGCTTLPHRLDSASLAVRQIPDQGNRQVSAGLPATERVDIARGLHALYA